jgi:hypothetical protein
MEPEGRTVPVTLAPKVAERCMKEAKAAGRKLAGFVQDLFDAAYAARVGHFTGDADLNRAVARAGTADPARALDIVTASLADSEATEIALRRQIEELTDERNQWRKLEAATQETLQAIGEEFGFRGGEPRVDGVRRVLTQMREALDRATAGIATRDEAIASLTGEAAQLIGEVQDLREKLRAKDAQPAGRLPVARLVPASAPDTLAIAPAAARLVRGLKAAGNSLAEIAAETGLERDTVAALLKGTAT